MRKNFKIDRYYAIVVLCWVEKMRIYNILVSSKVNGKGKRLVIWTQGCSILCKGCFNPETHDFSAGYDVTIEAIMEMVRKSDIDGVTISGGEPFDQKDALLNLVSALRDTTNLDIIVYSGYSLQELSLNELSRQILQKIDAVITGKYDEGKKNTRYLYGSSNQEVTLISDKFSKDDFEGPQEFEILVQSNGMKIITGFPIEGVF